MAPGAHLTLFWGATPVAMTYLTPGRAVGITEGGGFTPVTEGASLAVRMRAGGAELTRSPIAVGGARESTRLPLGADVELALAAPSGASVYRRGFACGLEPLVLRITLSAEDPRPLRRRALVGRASVVLAAVAAAHLGVFAMARAAMPPLAPFNEESLQSGPAPWSFAETIVPKPGRSASDEDYGGATDACWEQAGLLFGRTFALQGPIENSDPHLARVPASEDPYTSLGGIGPGHGIWGPGEEGPPRESHGGGDPTAATVPWGRDDSLGTDPSSASGTAYGPFENVWSTCFDPSAHGGRHCGAPEPPPPSPFDDLGLEGVGDAPPEVIEHRRAPRVVLGPIELAANVPRWLVLAGVRDAVEMSRMCYERALVDEPMLSGGVDAVIKVRGDEVSVKLHATGDVEQAAALRCCVEAAHAGISEGFPKGTQVIARYALTFGRR